MHSITDTLFTTSISKENGQLNDGIYFYKAEGGLWQWIGIVSNNRLDRHEEIITTKGHRYFVNAIEDGTYAKMMDVSMPELWVWHVPVPIGTVDIVSYDERGFLISAGKQLEGEFYSKVFEGLSKIADTLGMSHSFPAILTRLDPDNLNHIIEYMSREFTVLPLVKAANWLTGNVSLAYKELMKMLQIPEQKRQWFIESFGRDAVDDFDRRLEELEKAADAVGLPKKEFDMPEDKKESKETVVNQPVETPEVIEEVAEEVAEEEEEEIVSEEDVTEEVEDVEEPVAETGMSLSNFTFPKEALDEIVAGVKEPFDLILKEVQSANARLAVVEKELTSLKEAREIEGKEQEIAQHTPFASLAGQIAKSVIGSPEAQVDYNKEREMYSGPSETQEKETTAVTGISYVDEAINRQRSGHRVVPGSVLNGQQ